MTRFSRRDCAPRVAVGTNHWPKWQVVFWLAMAACLLVAFCATMASGQATSAGDSAGAAATDEPAKEDEDEKPVVRSTAEVNRLIAAAGSSAPEWWDDVELNYPNGMDLTWAKSNEGWKPNKYIGHYITSVLNPNPSKWRGGIKLLTHTLTVNKGNAINLQRSMQALGQAYFNYERDYARAAFWLQKAKPTFLDARVMLAECYWRLGSKPMAMAMLGRLGRDTSREGRMVQLYAAMGDLPRALRTAEAMTGVGLPDVAYLSAAIACRQHGKYAEAAKYYAKVATVTRGGRDLKRNKERAQNGLNAMQALARVDLSKISNGTYTGSSRGYRSDVKVEVKISDGKLEDCKVTSHREDMCFTAPTDIPAAIVANQGFKGVDAVTGATITSDAIINATAEALASGSKGD